LKTECAWCKFADRGLECQFALCARLGLVKHRPRWCPERPAPKPKRKLKRYLDARELLLGAIYDEIATRGPLTAWQVYEHLLGREQKLFGFCKRNLTRDLVRWGIKVLHSRGLIQRTAPRANHSEPRMWGVAESNAGGRLHAEGV